MISETDKENVSIIDIVEKIEELTISNDELVFTQVIASATPIIDNVSERSDAPSFSKFTPKKELDVSSHNDTVFSTPINALKMCCTDATCAVCLSPLLNRALVETGCKVKEMFPSYLQFNYLLLKLFTNFLIAAFLP
jgi:hypothetical protein